MLFLGLATHAPTGPLSGICFMKQSPVDIFLTRLFMQHQPQNTFMEECFSYKSIPMLQNCTT